MNKHYFFVIVSMLIFSSMGIFVRLLSVSGLVAYFFAALIAMLIFAVVLLKEKKLKKFFTNKHIWIPILIGVFGVVNNVSYFYSYKLTTIANATFLHYLAPLLVIILAPLLLREKTEKKVWFSLVLALFGLLILLNLTDFKLSSRNSLGMFLAFISAIGYSLGIIFFKKASEFYESKEILFSQMFFSVIILAPFILYLKPMIQASDIYLLLILGFIHQGIAVLLFIKALKKLPTQKVSIITYLEPLGAVILAVIFLSEIPTTYTLIGGGLILISCYLTIRK